MPQRSSPATDGAAAAPPDVRLEQLIEQVRRRLVTITDGGDSLQAVLDAMHAMASGVKLGLTLEQIMRAGAHLTMAARGTLEVRSCDFEILRYIHLGDEHSGRPGAAKTDRPVQVHASDMPRDDERLAALLDDPAPVRLPDFAAYPGTAGMPPGCRSTHSFIGVQVRIGDEMFGKLYLTDNRDGAFTADDVVVVQALAAAAGIAIQSRRRQLGLDAASEITTKLLTGDPAEQVLPLVAERAMELLRADATVITLHQTGKDQDGAELAAHAGLTDEQAAALVADGDEPTVTTFEGFGPMLRGALHSAGKEVGTITALRQDGSEPFEPEERVLLESFVDQASVVLEVRAKQEAHRRLGILSDRDRIARDLHDHVIQRLFAAGLSLQGILERIHDPEVRRRVDHTIDQLDDTVHELRTSIFNLHAPSESESAGLRHRLLDTVSDVCDASGLSPSTFMSGPIDTRVPDRLGDHADAVLREATTNAVRHSRATRLTVRIEATDDLVITVEDNGVGLPDDAPRSSGLRNMATRAEQCGGSLEITTPADGGTHVRWQAPLVTDVRVGHPELTVDDRTRDRSR